MKLTGKTKILGIIGDPIKHSLSPVMQNAAIQALGLDYVYVPFLVGPEDLAAGVAGLRALGVMGFNVTIPHKSTIIPLLDKISPEAELCGAVNTVSREQDLLVGYNTDGIGLLKSLHDDLRFQPDGTMVVVLGAGGAARGAVASLCAAGVSRIVIANRTLERGVALLQTFRHRFTDVTFELCSLDEEQLEVNLRDADLLLNTTSVGMNGTSFETVDISLLRTDAVVYDMVYSPAETALLASARIRGLSYANGIGMLTAQGEAAFSIWTNHQPPQGLMKQELLRELAI